MNAEYVSRQEFEDAIARMTSVGISTVDRIEARVKGNTYDAAMWHGCTSIIQDAAENVLASVNTVIVDPNLNEKLVTSVDDAMRREKKAVDERDALMLLVWSIVGSLNRFNERFSGTHSEKRGVLKFMIDEIRDRMAKIRPYDSSSTDESESVIPF